MLAEILDPVVSMCQKRNLAVLRHGVKGTRQDGRTDWSLPMSGIAGWDERRISGRVCILA
jgi:hypothetical protein